MGLGDARNTGQGPEVRVSGGPCSQRGAGAGQQKVQEGRKVHTH